MKKNKFDRKELITVYILVLILIIPFTWSLGEFQEFYNKNIDKSCLQRNRKDLYNCDSLFFKGR